MGVICDVCLKGSQKQPQLLFSGDEALLYNQNQIIFSKTLLSIESESLKNVEADVLFMFVDVPSAVLNNYFVKELGVSVKYDLQDRIQQLKIQEKENNPSGFIYKIQQPFYGVPIKRLVISEIKVFDGKFRQNKYLRKRIEDTFDNEFKSNRKKSVAIIEIESQLGYVMQQFQNVLMRKLKQVSDDGKLQNIVYMTHHLQKLPKLIRGDASNTSISFESSSLATIPAQEQSNYF